MRKLTKLLTLALAALMIMGSIVPASAAFSDVSVEDEALYEAVELLTTLGVAKGTTETTFGPDELVTRQQMAAFVYRLMKAGRSSEGGVNTTAFTDLNDATFYNMVSWANSQGIITGRSATEFDPMGNIVLQDAYTMLVRALGYEKDGKLNYPFDYIDIAESIGLDEDIPSTVGYTDKLTRGQVAILLANAFYADMNEKTTKYDWETSPDGSTQQMVAREITETVAHKIFGVEEENFFVMATAHNAYGQVAPLCDTMDDVDAVYGNRYDEDGNTVVAGEVIEMDDLGLDGESDDYFLAELTLFVKKDDTDAADDKIIAAKSNLIKKTVTAAEVKLETSTKTDEEYYVAADKDDGDKVMTGYATFGSMKAYLDIDTAPYSYTKDGGVSVTFIDLADGDYNEGEPTFNYVVLGDFDGKYNENKPTAYDGLSVDFEAKLPTVYHGGLYEMDVYDIDGDSYADLAFVKNYDFATLEAKKNQSFATMTGTGFKTDKAGEPKYTYIEDVTVEGDYEIGDSVLGYFNKDAAYIKVVKVVTPIEAAVTSKTKADKSQTISFASGEKVEFVDANKKFVNYNNAYTIDGFTAGKTYKAFIEGGIILFQANIGSGNFEADANYAYVIPHKGTVAGGDDEYVYTASGVVDGVYKSYYYVDAIIDGAERAVKLGEIGYAFENTSAPYGDLEDKKLNTEEKAEAFVEARLANQFSTYKVDSNGGYVFSEVKYDTSAFTNNDDKEEAVILTASSATIENYTGSIYTVTGLPAGINKFNMRGYSKMIIRSTTDDHTPTEPDYEYTLYTIENLPKFASTTFNNVTAIFVDNDDSTIENLGILYAEVDDGFASKATKDYRIQVGESQIYTDGKEKTVISVIDLVTGAKTDNIEITTAPGSGKYVIMEEDGDATAYTIATAYVENKLFNATFAEYDKENKFLTIGDGNTYIVNEDTVILYYKSTSVYGVAEDDIFTTEENSYEGLKDLGENETFKLDIIAEENDDNDSASEIKIAKTIVVRCDQIV